MPWYNRLHAHNSKACYKSSYNLWYKPLTRTGCGPSTTFQPRARKYSHPVATSSIFTHGALGFAITSPGSVNQSINVDFYSGLSSKNYCYVYWRRFANVQEAGLPWRLDFNPHTHSIPTAKSRGNPHGIPIPTEPRNLPYFYPRTCVFLLDAYFVLFIMYRESPCPRQPWLPPTFWVKLRPWAKPCRYVTSDLLLCVINLQCRSLINVSILNTQRLCENCCEWVVAETIETSRCRFSQNVTIKSSKCYLHFVWEKKRPQYSRDNFRHSFKMFGMNHLGTSVVY